MWRHLIRILSLAILAVAGCKRESPAPAAEPAAAVASPAALDPLIRAMFQPMPAVVESPDNPLTDEKVALGRMLYYEPRLSKNHDLSCNSCHDLARFGVDGKPVSPGHKGQLGTRNSPSVYNAAGRFAQFWDGRAATVEEQVKGPMLNPVEMAMTDDRHIVVTLESIPEYVKLFQEAFPDSRPAVTVDNAARAIGAFERKLVTPSRWDRLLAGEQDALTAEEKAGATRFVAVGCAACHGGAFVGGAMFQKMGVFKPWPHGKDQGRFDVTGNEADKMMFVVPSLRNVARTAPYFHDGSVETLEEAVKLMAEHELGRALEDADVSAIVTWLDALTGEIPEQYIARPELPPSGPKTPRPNPL